MCDHGDRSPRGSLGCKHGWVQPSDGDLVCLARAGEAGAWAALLGRHVAAMHAVAASVLGPGADARTWCRMPRWSRSPGSAGSGTCSGAGVADGTTSKRGARAPDAATDRVVGPRQHPDDAPETRTAPDRGAALRDWVWEAIGTSCRSRCTRSWCCATSAPPRATTRSRWPSGSPSAPYAAACTTPARRPSRLRDLELESSATPTTPVDPSARAAVRRDRRRSTTAA